MREKPLLSHCQWDYRKPQWVTLPVETNKTVFIAVTFQQTVVNSSPVSMDNVIPRFPMLERRRYKYNFRPHMFSVTQNWIINNKLSQWYQA